MKKKYSITGIDCANCAAKLESKMNELPQVEKAVLGMEIVLTAVRNMFHGKVFDENFLMTIATIGAFIIGDFAEAVGVMLFYRIGEFFEDVAVNKTLYLQVPMWEQQWEVGQMQQLKQRMLFL